jgi:hypothetical protein
VPRERREHHRTAQRPATAGGDGVRQISGGGPQKRAFLAVERFSTAVGRRRRVDRRAREWRRYIRSAVGSLRNGLLPAYRLQQPTRGQFGHF